MYDLNDKQLEALIDKDNPIFVNAGAGSGKTRVLTYKILYLIQEQLVQPDNILAITFTNKAANEMKERLAKLHTNIIINEYGEKGIWVKTFHSAALKILRTDISLLGYKNNFLLYDDDDKKAIIKSIIKEHNLENELYKKAIKFISYLKNKYIEQKDIKDIDVIEDDFVNKNYLDKDNLLLIYKEYEKRMQNNGCLDFDDLIIKVVELFLKNKQILKKYQEKFKYILVDEFQDINDIQYKFVKLLAQEHKKIFVVGDEDQSIYSWRGANISNLYNFQKDFNCKIYTLDQNYRSTKNILDIANNIIKNNLNRIEKKLWTENSKGTKVEVIRANNELDEAYFVCQKINQLRDEYNYDYSEFAVLMRQNALTRSFEDAFTRFRIPYKIYGGYKFYNRKIIKDLLAYFRIRVNKNDSEAILRIINFPRRGIGAKSIDKLIECETNNKITLFEVINNYDKFFNNEANSFIEKIKDFNFTLNEIINLDDKNVFSFLNRLIDILNLKKLFEEESTKDNINHINELLNATKMFLNSGLNTVSDFLDMVYLFSESDEDANNSVILSTMHSAKGLEFKVVFIIGLEKGIMPSSRSIDENGIEEERRLMYVAITRAKEKLFMSYCRSRSLNGIKQNYIIKSIFLDECGLFTKEDDNNKTERGKYTSTRIYQPQSYFKENVLQIKNKDTSLFKVGDEVIHARFGEGIILNIQKSSNEFADIKFKDGIKTISLKFAPIKKLKLYE